MTSPRTPGVHRSPDRLEVAGTTLAAVLTIVLYVVFLLGMIALGVYAGRTDVPPSPAVTVPEEGEPGWDCRVHGNRDCGPGFPVTDGDGTLHEECHVITGWVRCTDGWETPDTAPASPLAREFRVLV